MPLIDPKTCPYYMFSRLTLGITSALKLRLSKADLTQVKPAYLWALMSLWVTDGLKVTEIARAAGLETSTMTGLLDRMERDGLVTRTADPADRRVLRIYLTEEGRRMRGPVIAETCRVLDQLFEGVPEEHLELVKTTLTKIMSRLQQQGD
ncbi:MAG: MarR family transcriptional regulator [Thermodesulfobacteriota bacterium]